MILVAPTTPRSAIWTVECSEHGRVGRQTTLDYALERATIHGCVPVVYVKREQRYDPFGRLQETGKWEINRVDDWEGPTFRHFVTAVEKAREIGAAIMAGAA